jgi:hypothetical protein
VLVAGEPLQALQIARDLREKGRRAVLDLDEPPASESVLGERAKRMGLEEVILAGADGAQKVR